MAVNYRDFPLRPDTEMTKDSLISVSEETTDWGYKVTLENAGKHLRVCSYSDVQVRTTSGTKQIITAGSTADIVFSIVDVDAGNEFQADDISFIPKVAGLHSVYCYIGTSSLTTWSYKWEYLSLIVATDPFTPPGSERFRRYFTLDPEAGASTYLMVMTGNYVVQPDARLSIRLRNGSGSDLQVQYGSKLLIKKII